MPQITNLTATYSRTAQPAQYESVKAELSASVAFEDGEDSLDLGSGLLAALGRRCYAALNLKVPPHLAEQALIEKTEAAAETAVAEAKRRGRPAGSKNKATEAPAAPAVNPTPIAAPEPATGATTAKATTAVSPASPEADPILGGSLKPVERVVGKAPELAAGYTETKPMNYAIDPLPGAPAPLEISDKDLSAKCAETARRVADVDAVWKLLGDFGVVRGGKMGDIPAARRADFLKAADALKAKS